MALQFTSGGAEASNAIQKFLMERAVQQRQAQLDALDKQKQQQDEARMADDLKLRQQQEQRVAEQQKATLADAENQRQFSRANTIAENALPGDAVDASTQQLLQGQGFGGQLKKIPGVVSQGAQLGTDENGVPQYDVSQTPDSVQMRGGSKYMAARTAADERAAQATQAETDREAEAQRQRDFLATQADANRQNARALAGSRASSADDALVKVDHEDPTTHQMVTEYLPKSEVRGKSFAKGAGQTVANRLASAQAVQQTGNDIISKLSDPAYASQVGPALGRYNSVQAFIGNPPPEYADLAGMIESYSLASMGVHGMRSAQGAEAIKALLNQKATPAALIATIRGLNAFSEHFMENEGRGTQTTPTNTATAGGAKEYDYIPGKGLVPKGTR